MTRTNMGGPTVWKYPEECGNEWDRVKEMRKAKDPLVDGGRRSEPNGVLITKGSSGQFRSKYN